MLRSKNVLSNQIMRFLLYFSMILGCALSLQAQITVRPHVHHAHTHILWTPSKKPQRTTTQKLSREEQFLVQIFLDEHGFGPGVIDGAMGSFSYQAVRYYYQSIGHPASSDLALVLGRAFRHMNLPCQSATVPADLSHLVKPSLPHKYRILANYKSVPYRSYRELMAERYHTSEAVLNRLNPDRKLSALAPGESIIVPNVQPFRIEDLPSASYKPYQSVKGNHVVINVRQKSLVIYNNAGAVLAYYPVTTGVTHRVRYGDWKVANSVPNPHWKYTPGNSQSYIIPPGPNSPVGVIWNGLSAKSIGIHGTNSPETIGRSRSAGCIRLANWDVVKFVQHIRPGCKVKIQ